MNDCMSQLDALTAVFAQGLTDALDNLAIASKQTTDLMTHYDLLGFVIHVSPDTPKRQLSSGVTVSAAFRASYNHWLSEFFGYDNRLEDGQVYTMGRDAWMNPRTFADYKRTLESRDLKPGDLGYLGGM